MTTSGLARERLFRGITRNVIALGFVSFFTDISSELLVYVIPLYLANVLGASSAVIGIIEGVVESASATLKLISGIISDRVARRRILVGVGYAASVVSKAIYLLAASWPVVLVARLGDRVGKGIRTAPRDALIADSTPPEARGRAFGLQRAMDTAGAVVGVAVAALVVTALQGDTLRLDGDTFRTLVLLALVPGALAVAVIVVGVRDVGSAGPESRRPAAAGSAASAGSASAAGSRAVPGPVLRPGLRARAARFPAPFWLFIAAAALFTLGNSSDAFIALRSQQLGVAVRDLLLMVIAFNVTNTLIAWPAGALSDVVGRRGLIFLAWVIYAASYAGFAVASSPVAVPFLWILYGAYYGVIEAAGRALIADLAPADIRATGYGIYNTALGLALLPASIVAGLLWDRVGPSSAFWFGAACAAGAAVMLWTFVRPARRSEASAAA